MTKGIYKLFTDLSDKVYIGSSVNIEHRFNVHRSLLRSEMHPSKTLQEEINLAGLDALKVRLIEEVGEGQEILDREWYWINHFDSIKNGHNSATVWYKEGEFKSRTNGKEPISVKPIHITEGDYYTVQDVAKARGVSRQTVQNWIAQGWLATIQVNRNLHLVPAEEAELFIPPKQGPKGLKGK